MKRITQLPIDQSKRKKSEAQPITESNTHTHTHKKKNKREEKHAKNCSKLPTTQETKKEKDCNFLKDYSEINTDHKLITKGYLKN